jgi:hypothetical protein
MSARRTHGLGYMLNVVMAKVQVMPLITQDVLSIMLLSRRRDHDLTYWFVLRAQSQTRVAEDDTSFSRTLGPINKLGFAPLRRRGACNESACCYLKALWYIFRVKSCVLT